jgi:hypothetical protein
MLLALGVLLTVYAQPIMNFMEATASSLYAPGEQAQAVLSSTRGGRQ